MRARAYLIHLAGRETIVFAVNVKIVLRHDSENSSEGKQTRVLH